METYSKEYIVEFMDACKAGGIQEPGRLYPIQTALRAGLGKVEMEALANSQLTEMQMLQILGLALNDVPGEILTQISQKPVQLQALREKYYSSLYGADRSRIYQEVFDGFQVQWQNNFKQLLKQTETFSDMLEFLKMQLMKREREAESLEEKKHLLEKEVQKERRRAENLEQERTLWETAYLKLDQEEQGGDINTQDNMEEYMESGKEELKINFLGGIFREKRFSNPYPEKKIISLIKNLNDEQIEEVLAGCEQGLSIKQVRTYAKEEYSAGKMRKIRRLLLNMKEKTIDGGISNA